MKYWGNFNNGRCKVGTMNQFETKKGHSMDKMKLIKTTGECAIFCIDGAIVPVEIDPDSWAIIKYYNKIAINDI